MLTLPGTIERPDCSLPKQTKLTWLFENIGFTQVSSCEKIEFCPFLNWKKKAYLYNQWRRAVLLKVLHCILISGQILNFLSAKQLSRLNWDYALNVAQMKMSTQARLSVHRLHNICWCVVDPFLMYYLYCRKKGTAPMHVSYLPEKCGAAVFINQLGFS